MQSVVFVWIVVCSGIWSWNTRLTNNITAFLWRAINEGITVLLEKWFIKLHWYLYCVRGKWKKEKAVFFCNDVSSFARKDVLWCFSQGGFFTNYCIPEVRVDPDGRCAAMLVYGTHMVILPFRRDVMVEEGDNLAGTRYFLVKNNKYDVTNSPNDCNLLQLNITFDF